MSDASWVAIVAAVLSSGALTTLVTRTLDRAHADREAKELQSIDEMLLLHARLSSTASASASAGDAPGDPLPAAFETLALVRARHRLLGALVPTQIAQIFGLLVLSLAYLWWATLLNGALEVALLMLVSLSLVAVAVTAMLAESQATRYFRALLGGTRAQTKQPPRAWCAWTLTALTKDALSTYASTRDRQRAPSVVATRSASA
ncbi:hypothetical protein [Cellulosimicrobium cellulans]|uniref:hypothetical protein n=1 Tax=Cellulosimicrobium cellulans TaxID=1710 RepID=UPI001BA6B63A|nr:hypothetical protein [Cellulosimicrobium cellulans]QUB99517.1 hypothetical protein J5A69_17805 [Cellulosimicrobium cellulans]